MKTQFKSINVIHLIFICFIFTLFVNCSGKDTSVREYPSQAEDDGNSDNNGDGDSNNDGNSDNNDADDNSDDGNDNNNNDDNDNDNDYNFTERSENAPDLRHIIEQLAEQCPEQMKALSDGQGCTDNLDFLDLVVAALRKEDKRWGYTFWDGHSWAAPDVIGYYRGNWESKWQ